MNITKIEVGKLKCNCYLLEKDNNCILIDPGADYQKIKEFIRGKNIIGILITHKHDDHIGCALDLVNEYKIPVYSNQNLQEGINHISTFSFEVIRTFGHTMDSITFYFDKEKVMFTGDFLFYDTIGRCDFLESDYNEMIKSIAKIKNYQNDIIIYPGHGKETNLGREKIYNMYFN